MIIRGTPHNTENFIIVYDNAIAYQLQIEGFFPKYVDSEAMYFVKNKEIEKFLSVLSIIEGVDNERVE